ncbi:sugar MFS transporter [Catenovulum sp. SM1970]|uniref:sugar MFS transporter n=1 Tax=Marinifaba aquimaris TaxID=2741323 RepID=UPI0015749350|nr:sugar MFS transporter [Marinifaba aquimaris]NTS77075.1 sugar MFS transporter [Marinifaba aquimaris]
MAGAMPTGGSAVTTDNQGSSKYGLALVIMVTLFFMIGFITVLNDVLIPRLKDLFSLTNQDAMLVMFVFFGAYLVWSYPSGMIVQKIGFKKGIIGALATVGLGLALFVPAAHAVQYWIFLLALFVVASGLTLLQVCINPYLIALGPPETGASRLNLGGALNSTATFIGPIIGGAFILQHIASPEFPKPSDINNVKSIYSLSVEQDNPELTSVAALASLKNTLDYQIVRQLDEQGLTRAVEIISPAVADLKRTTPEQADQLLRQVKPIVLTIFTSEQFATIEGQAKDVWWAYKLKNADSVLVPYVALAVITFLLAIALVYVKLPKIESEELKEGEHVHGSAWDYMHMKLGALAIFFYVGVEVSIGAILILYLETDEMGGIDHMLAASLLAYYWGSAMVGRFIGSYVGTKVEAQVILRFVTIAAIVLLALSFMPFTLNSFMDVSVFVLNPSPFSMGFESISVPVAAICLVLCGLCHSVMWPSIFTLGIAKLGKHTSQGSGVMVAGVFGGAVIPLAIGAIADSVGYKLAFLLCAVCYAYILFYAMKGYYTGKITTLKADEVAES